MNQEEYYFEICKTISKKSTCSKMMVGAILVKDKVIISTGYNGSPRGVKHCDDIGHMSEDGHCIATVHAEENCILNAARIGINIQGSEMYCTHKPCFRCLQRLINSGIEKINFLEDYKDDFQLKYESKVMLKHCKTFQKSIMEEIKNGKKL